MNTSVKTSEKFIYNLPNVLFNLITVHSNYVFLDNNKEPYALSVCLTDSENHGIQQYRAILWQKSVSVLSLKDFFLRRNPKSEKNPHCKTGIA